MGKTMRKISPMYQWSGGTDYRHTCAECKNLVTIRKCSRAIYKCRSYGNTSGHETDWKASSVACKAFGQDPPAVPLIFQDSIKNVPAGAQQHTTEIIYGQMSIFDYPEMLPYTSKEDKKCS